MSDISEQRRYYERMIDEIVETCREQHEKLQAENAKLRELVRIAGIYCANGLCGKNDGCPLYIGKPYCAFPDRMRELGVE